MSNSRKMPLYPLIIRRDTYLWGTQITLNSDNNHSFYNDNDNGNKFDIYNNDKKYHYPSELEQIIRISAFVCLLLKEFRISLISLWIPSHIGGEATYVVGISE